jgi:hypothetical protein
MFWKIEGLSEFTPEFAKHTELCIRDSRPSKIAKGGAVFLTGVLLFVSPLLVVAQQTLPVTGEIKLASGEYVSYWGVFSHSKLRRGTEMGLKYTLMIGPEACFLLAGDKAAGLKGVKVELSASPGLVATVMKAGSKSKATLIQKVKVKNCSDTIGISAKIVAPMEQPFGMQKIGGQIRWQAMGRGGTLPPQTTSFEFSIEVVEHGDRTAKYNDYYGFRPTPDLLWRIPALPFVLVYCMVTGPDCPD